MQRKMKVPVPYEGPCGKEKAGCFALWPLLGHEDGLRSHE